MFFSTAPNHEFEVALRKGINDNIGLGIYARKYVVIYFLYAICDIFISFHFYAWFTMCPANENKMINEANYIYTYIYKLEIMCLKLM